jgi:hypothetical protein
MAKRLTPQANLALQEALSVIYHYKKDLRRFLESSGVDRSIVGNANWDGYKRDTVSEIFTVLMDSPSAATILTTLCRDVSAMDNFSHLADLEDGNRKVQKAKKAVEELRRLVDKHENQDEDQQAALKRREKQTAQLSQREAFQRKLNQICSLFHSASLEASTPQQRGSELEVVMTELFELFDLDPRASFRIRGEQIDGAFTLDGTDYLFEAKWEKKPLERASLDEFVSKISRKLDNTLGLLLSMSGFTETAVEKFSDRRATLLLMDRFDLQAVLEQRIDFVEMLRRKRRHAAETGDIFFQIYPTVI